MFKKKMLARAGGRWGAWGVEEGAKVSSGMYKA